MEFADFVTEDNDGIPIKDLSNEALAKSAAKETEDSEIDMTMMDLIFSYPYCQQLQQLTCFVRTL